MKSEKRQCSETVWGERGGGYPCQKPAVVERDGKFYCRIHDPEYIKAKNQKYQDEWDKARIKRNAQWERESVLRTITEGLTTEELTALTPALLRAAIPMRDKLEKIKKWLESLARDADNQAVTTRFITIKEACKSDARNFKATIADIDVVLAQAKEGEKL